MTVELVKESPTKTLVVLGEGNYQEFENNGKVVEKLVLPVNFDSVEKNWVLNKPSATAMIEALGKDTKNWVGQTVPLKIIKTSQGLNMILALPETDAKPVEEKIE